MKNIFVLGNKKEPHSNGVLGSNEIYAKNVFPLTVAFDCATTNSRKDKNLRSEGRNVEKLLKA